MPSLVATTSTPAQKPFVRTHYVRTNLFVDDVAHSNVIYQCSEEGGEA